MSHYWTMDSTIRLHGLVSCLEIQVVCFVFSCSCLIFKAFSLLQCFLSIFCSFLFWLRLTKSGWSPFIGWLMDNSKKPGLTAKLRIHINTDREASCASPSITDARLTPLDCAMPVPLQRPSGWQLAWWRMMFWRANEHGACRFITPVPRRPSAKLTDEHMREREKKNTQNKRREA